MQTHLKQPRKIAIFIDEEILDFVAEWCSTDIQCLEGNDDEFETYTPEEALKARFWFMHKHKVMKRLADAINPVLKDLGKLEVKYR